MQQLDLSSMKRRVAVIGATGMVGQRFVTLLARHPWFELCAVAASARSAGKTYEEAVQGRWAMQEPIPQAARNLVVIDAADTAAVCEGVDFCFCAVDMPKAAVRELEDACARLETPVVSNNSAHRGTPDVPMIIPELNPEHAGVIEHQRRRLGTRVGFVTVKPNCSIQSYVPALHALMPLRPLRAVVSTYQAISGAGKTFERWPEMLDNVIPYISGEEEKSEQEPLKIWGRMQDGVIVPATQPVISAQCVRVAASDGHLATVWLTLGEKATPEDLVARWRAYRGLPQQLGLPSAPDPFISYFDEPDRPQTRLDRDAGHGMGITLGRLRADSLFDFRFVGLSHNTLRGAAGGGVLIAELLVAQGYIPRK